MCSNYRPVTRSDHLLQFFGVHRDEDALPADCWPTGMAPFIRLATNGQREIHNGHFGLLAHFETQVTAGRRTYNARCETVHSKPSYRDAWKRSQRCIVPAESIYEPNWETGQAVRWRINQTALVPMGIAGIYTHWQPADGSARYTFSMLTCNADGHPVMSRFHKPEDEKRMVVILDPRTYEDWLTCSPDEARQYFRQWNGPLEAEPAPVAPKTPKAPKSGSVRTAKPPKADPTGDLF